MEKVTFGKKFQIINGICLVLVLIIFCGITIGVIYKQQAQDLYTRVDGVVANAGEGLLGKLTLIDQLNRSIFLTGDMQELLDEFDSISEDAPAQAAANINTVVLSMQSFCEPFLSLEQSLINEIIFIPFDSEGGYDTNRVFYYGLNTESVAYNFPQVVAAAQEAENARGKLFIRDFYSSLSGQRTTRVIFARNILDIRTTSSNYMGVMGIGILVINKSKIQELFYEEAINGLTLYVERDGTDFYGEIPEDNFLRSSRYYVSQHALDNYGFEIFGIYDKHYNLDAIGGSVLITLLCSMCICIGLLVFFMFLNHRTSVALRYLFNTFSDIRISKKTHSITYTKDKQVNNVIGSFNSMLDELTSLSDQMVKEQNKLLLLQVENMQFRLDSLYSQINKHFLINVLSVIRSLIATDRGSEAKVCLEKLSEFLRYTLTEEMSATLGKELEIAEIYMDIQKARYPKVSYTVSCDERVREIAVPKMILQPIIENSFTHSLRTKRGEIGVVARKRKSGVTLFIYDNGAGIAEERLEQVNGCLKNGEGIPGRIGSGVALVNIQKRIQMTVGERSCIRMQRRISGGTLTVIRLILKEGRAENV